MDNVGIVLNDLAAAIAFFVELGFEGSLNAICRGFLKQPGKQGTV
jgi:hypothetical protein